MGDDTVIINPCAPIFATENIFGGNNIQGGRKAIVVEIFLTYLIYVILLIQGARNDKYPNDGQNPGKKNDVPSSFPGRMLNIDYQNFQRFFFPFFGYHIICAGLSVLYSPYPFAIVISWIHLFVFIGLCVAHQLEKPQKMLYGLYSFCQLLNIILIISGLSGLGYSDFSRNDQYQLCRN